VFISSNVVREIKETKSLVKRFANPEQRKTGRKIGTLDRRNVIFFKGSNDWERYEHIEQFKYVVNSANTGYSKFEHNTI
jgi:hypothetical protein